MRMGLTNPQQWEEVDRSPEARLAYADVLLERANAYLESELRDTDVLDDKALQLTTGDIAAFTILVTFQHSWFWSIPEVLLALAAFFFFLVYKPRSWEIGPDLEDFRPPDTPHAPADASAIKLAMADQILWAANENHRRIGRKSNYFRWGLWILGIGLVLSFVLTVVDK
jgi:hypothetical protein